MKTVAILADGEPPADPRVLALLSGADELVACDGALAKARRLGREPDFTVGDGDSLPAAERRRLGERFVRVSEQETNDLAKAWRFVLARHPRGANVDVFGAWGLREDHALANVFHFAELAAAAPGRARLFAGRGLFAAVPPGRWRRFAARARAPVSVFAFARGTCAESRGLEWPLAGAELEPFWRGASNLAAGGRFAVRADRPLVVYLPYASWTGDGK